ncbi:hypothetical protein ACQ5SO_08510 [Rhodovulum sp. DZ06]|uniref:hypothetical protein n=1 Tax=Rhodovulum sp. DZ06 TaxID=3425126 RepID=UPI003D34A857
MAEPALAGPVAGPGYAVEKVIGGEETSPIAMSKVSDGAFQQALAESLRRIGLLDPATGLKITATLIALDQPIVGFDLTVKATGRYQVHDAEGRELYDEMFTTPCKAPFSSSLLAVERLRLANEGAIKANIAAFLEDLVKTRHAAGG